MRPFRRVVLAAAFAAAAMLTPALASTGQAFGPVFECPPAEATLQTFQSLQADRGPLSGRYGELLLNERALACIGSGDVSFTAFRAQPEGLGGVVRYTVNPAWLDTWTGSRFFLARSDAETEPGIPEGPFFAVAVPPKLEDTYTALAGEWVTVTGHLDDRAAKGCRIVGPTQGVVPDARDVVQLCRTSFVVTAMSVAVSPCPAGPIEFASIAAVPEHMRAHCFGYSPVSFDAWGGGTRTIAWALVRPPVSDWTFFDPNVRPGAADRRFIEAWVPAEIEIPNPADAPWKNTDGIGGDDIWWRVTGHFDDARAERCRPAPDGVITANGRRLVWSPEDAHDVCRNRLFVDELVWLRTGPLEAAAATSTPLPPAATTNDVEAAPQSLAPLLVLIPIVAAVAGWLLLRTARRRG